jgi:nucleoside-diphosphate-sugar epimerase
VEELLNKDIQIIGVDNFSSGSKDNLGKATMDKNFHLLSLDASRLELELPRLDYIYIVAGDGWDLTNVLNLANTYRSKLAFVSSIELYDSKGSSELNWYKEAEIKIAKFTADNKLNARVIRLAEIYGPRMHFREEGCVTRLISSCLKNQLQKESTALDFSCRSLYIDDAISLIIKSMMSGATALKIFDGSLLTPVKVAEVKQILLDPIWHETREFKPSELPPWPTPNLIKTIEYLSWHPRANLVKSLRVTLNYFKTHSLSERQDENKNILDNEWTQKIKEWREPIKKEEEKKASPMTISPQKAAQLKELKEAGATKKDKKTSKKSRVFWGILIFSIIFYALFYPILTLGWGIFTFRSNLANASVHLEKGEFNESITSINNAKGGIALAGDFLDSLEIFKKAGAFPSEFQTLERLLKIGNDVADASDHAVLGTQSLFDSLKTISGELNSDPKVFLDKSQVELLAADVSFSTASIALNEQKGKLGFLNFLQPRVDDLANRVEQYANLVKQAKSTTRLLPQLIALDSKKSYLILLQNNNELRPTGGFIGSLARVDFEKGKLIKLDVQDVYNIDGQLKR